MEPKLALQFENIIRQIIRDEIGMLIGKPIEDVNGTNQVHYSEVHSQGLISSKIGWLKDENTLLKLHQLLISHGFIDCKFKIFKPHFIGNGSVIVNIQWLSQTKRLVYLFDQLMSYKYIPKSSTQHQLIKEHFLDKHNNRLQNNSLRSTLNDIRNSKGIKIIENIIAELHKNNN